MPGLKLVLPAAQHKELYLDMMREWTEFGGKLNPGALKSRGASYEQWLLRIENERDAATCPPDLVMQTLYFLMEDDRLLGAVSIRHYLNENLLNTGGHIGYGIRPAERRKNYATQMLAMALDKCRELGISKALVTCNEDNVGSRKTILKNGGVHENDFVEENGTVVQRYWIQL